MKWIFALNQSVAEIRGENYELLAKVAVLSARKNAPRLEPIMIYNGVEDRFSAEMKKLGVKVILHRLSFQDAVETADRRTYTWKHTAKGAFLRLDIPELISGDETILYTDCDVMFLSDPTIFELKTNFFAVAPEFSVTDYLNINTGAMVLNLGAARKSFVELKAWTLSNIQTVEDFDQGAIKTFYKGKWDKLSPLFNWKPYWGANPSAVIVHFHGPKPLAFDPLTLQPKFAEGILKKLYDASPQAYSQYLKTWIEHYHNHLINHS